MFIDSAIKHAEASKIGDSNIANDNYKNIIAAVLFLKEKNELEKLAELLNDQPNSVKLWAATNLLSIKRKEAVKILEEIESSSGDQSFEAKWTLIELRKGNLKS